MKKRTLAVTYVLLTTIFFSLGSISAFVAPEVIDFELEVELKDRQKYDIEYEVRDGMFEAEYQVPGAETIYGEEAKAMIDPLLEQLDLQPNKNKKDLMEQIIAIFEIDQESIDDFELEVKFGDGKKIKIDRYSILT